MAATTDGRRSTRSRKTTAPDGVTEKPEYEPQPRSLRSSKVTSTDIDLKGNCAVVITKLKSENIINNTKKAKRQSPVRKRTRVDKEDVNTASKKSKAKVLIVIFL